MPRNPTKKKIKTLTNLPQHVNACQDCGCHQINYKQKCQQQVQELKTQVSTMQTQHQTEVSTMQATHKAKVTRLENKNASLKRDLQQNQQQHKIAYKDMSAQVHVEVSSNNDIVQSNADTKRALAAALKEQQTLRDAISSLEAKLEAEQTAHSQTKLDFRLFQEKQAKELEQSKKRLKSYQDQREKQLQKVKRRLTPKKHVRTKRVKTTAAVVKTHLANFNQQMQREVLAALSSEVDNPTTAQPVGRPRHVEAKAGSATARSQKKRDLTKLSGLNVDLKDLFSQCEPHEILMFLPEEFVNLLQLQGARQFSNQLSEHWTYLIGAFLINQLSLSRRKYNELRAVLFKRYNKTTGQFENLQINGVTVPLPPSWEKIQTWKAAKLEHLDIEIVQLSNSAAAISVSRTLSVALQQETAKGHFLVNSDGELVSALNSKKPLVQVSFDAAHTCRGRKTTAFAVKFINGAFSNVYKYNHVFAILEGGDDHASISSAIGDVIKEVNELVLNSVVSVDNVDQSVEVYATADQAAVHASHGMCGSDHLFACPFCHCPNTSFSKPAEGTGHDKRSLELLEVLAHVKEGYCPGCELQVVANVTDAKTQTKLVNPFADVKLQNPTFPKHLLERWKKEGKKIPTWNQAHFGKRYGVVPLLQIEPAKWAICILHLNLRIVGTMFKKTVFENLTNKPGDTLKAKQLYECLLENQIPVDRVKQTSDNVQDYYDSVSKHGFAGEDCLRLLKIYPLLLDILFPPLQSTSRSDQKKIADYQSVWQYWDLHLFPEINKRTSDVIAKANLVRTRAVTFCALWQAAFGSPSTLYLHLLAVHLPEQILAFPADPLHFSLQGLEHCNKRRKQFKEMSNCHKTTKQIQVTAYVKADGTRVSAHEKSSGPTMATQLLTLITVSNIVTAEFYGEEDEQRQLEQTRRNNQLKKNSLQNTCTGS